MSYKLNAMYFSATGTTEKVVCGIAKKLWKNIGLKEGKEHINIMDFTLPQERQKTIEFSKDDILIIGVPVYAGRVPNVLTKYLKSISGNGALAISVVVYGNRNYDDALIELKDILEWDGFRVIAGAAFIGEHSFSNTLAKNRPDEKDMELVSDFADKIYNKVYKKILDGNEIENVFVKGIKPYRKYYMPKDENGKDIDIRKVQPKTRDSCINCKLCARVCPMGSIDFQDVTRLNGICIKCCACIKKCPVGAKYFEHIGYLKHKHELEIKFEYRQEPEVFW